MDLLSNNDRLRKLGSRHTQDSPYDLVGFLTYACLQLEVPYDVKVNVRIQGDYHSEDRAKKLKRTATGAIMPIASQPVVSTSEELTLSEREFNDATDISITAVMNNSGHVVEIIFNRCVAIPRQLIKVIGLCIPYHPHLRRLTVRWGPLTTAALYEFSKFLFHPFLTEICLDDSPVAGRNYEVLLERPSHLHFLSLARCELDDDDCVRIAALLAPDRCAAASLHILALACNCIGDQGARALATVLRANRALRCLNLAGNHITDVGAVCILRTLMEFPLTTEEVVEKRKRRFDYLRRRSEVFATCLKELNREKSLDEIRLSKRRMPVSRGNRKVSSAISVTQLLHERAGAMADEILGEISNPFSREQTMVRAGQLYCVGNTALCYLNLSYNNLEIGSLTALFEVLTHQSWLGERAAPGLLHVSIEGNALPVECDLLFLLDTLLQRAVAARLRPCRRVLPDRQRTARLAAPLK